MGAMSSFHIKRCPKAPSEHKLNHVTNLINEVYKVAEAGLWKSENGISAPRTNRDELIHMCAQQQLLFAYSDNVVVGSINTVILEPSLAELGMLVADPKRRGE